MNKSLLNMVHSDEIWKYRLHCEKHAHAQWSTKWGFLSDVYKELHHSSSSTSKEENSTSCKDEFGEEIQEPPKRKFPQTDSQLIGWKSAFIKQGAYGIPEDRAKGKCDLYRTLKWPQEK